MIGVQMGNEDAVNRVVGQAGGFEPAADAVAAIHEQGSLAQAVEERGMIAVGAWPAVTDSKTS